LSSKDPDSAAADQQVQVPRILEIREQLKTLPGQRVIDALRELDRPVRFLLAPNGAELVQLLTAFEEHPSSVLLWAQGNEEQMNAFLGEVQRKTHNLVASVVTVIDHTRRILQKEWPDAAHPIRVEFDAARQVFLTDARLVVVRDLRNFCLHRSLPNIVGQLHFGEQSSVTHRALLSKVSLLEWDGWKAPAKAYLDEADDTIELRPLVVHYVDQALQLQNSVIASIRTHEADVLAPWQQLAEEHDAHVSEVIRRTTPAYPQQAPASNEAPLSGVDNPELREPAP